MEESREAVRAATMRSTIVCEHCGVSVLHLTDGERAFPVHLDVAGTNSRLVLTRHSCTPWPFGTKHSPPPELPDVKLHVTPPSSAASPATT